MFLMWLIVMVVAVFLLGIVIAIPNCVSNYQELVRAGAPKPSLILCKQFLGLFLGGRRKANPVLIEKNRSAHLKDTMVWLNWDVRWIGSGKELGTIVDITHNSDCYQLLVKVTKPIHFAVDDNGFNEVVFEPHNPVAFINRNKFSSTNGIIKTPNELRELNIVDVITCVVSTLGKHNLSLNSDG